MLSLLLASSVWLIGDEGRSSTAQARPDMAAYESAKAKAGHDADAHVRLALWCESHNLPAERMKHLALAVLHQPSNTLARGLMGLVSYRGKWEAPDAVGREVQNDAAYRELLGEYLERRARAPHKADAQVHLAAWCEQKGLKEQAVAHYCEVLRLDPSREAAWRHLGYKRHGDRWVKPDQLAAEKIEAERQKRADKLWKPKLERLREALEGKAAARRTNADRTLAEVTDPLAVPMVWAVMVHGGARSQSAAVQVLGQIDGPSASGALAVLAIFSPSAEVRGRATETLAHRDARDVIGKLISLMRKPFKYEVRPVNGPGSTGVLFVEGERFNVRRLYDEPPIDPSLIPTRIFAPSIPFDPFNAQNLVLTSMATGAASPSTTANAANAAHAIAAHPQSAGAILGGLPGTQASAGPNPSANLVYDTLSAAAHRDLQIASAYQAIQQADQALQRKLVLDLETVETTNTQITQLNGRVLPVLKSITGQDFGVEPEKWKGWWTDQLGYVYQSNLPEIKPTYTDFVSVRSAFTVGGKQTPACFAAGTMVVTIDGLRAIETIRVGDRVLSQDTMTGLISFQPVVAVHHNMPSPTLRIAFDGETIAATGIHRFWKAGKGWTMARDLKAGDPVRMIGGTATVRAVEADAVRPVFNLDVADHRDFFVGSKGLLVHDFSFVHPVLAPFDREPELTSSAPSR